MEPFEGSFLLLDALARTTEGFSVRDDAFYDLVVGYDDSAYSGPATLNSPVTISTANGPAFPGSFEADGFSASGVAFSPSAQVVDVVGAAATGAPTVPASTVAVAGDIDLLVIGVSFSSTVPNLPSGYTSIAYDNSSVASAVRLCYRVLTGPSTSTVLSDHGESNYAYRFIIRNSSGIGYSGVEAGVANHTSTRKIYDNNTDGKLDLILAFCITNYLAEYSDLITSSFTTLPPYQIVHLTGTYGSALAYTYYAGPFSADNIPITTHFSSAYGAESNNFAYVDFNGATKIETSDTVLVLSEEQDVFYANVESAAVARIASFSLQEPPDLISIAATIPEKRYGAFSAILEASIVSSGEVTSGGAAIIDLLFSSEQTLKKDVTADISLQLNGQAVPVVRKTIHSQTVSFSFSHTVNVSTISDNGEHKFSDAVINCASSLFLSGARDRFSGFSIQATSSVEAQVRKRLIKNALAASSSSVDVVVSKEIFPALLVELGVYFDTEASKSVFPECPDQLSGIVTASGVRGAGREFFASYAASTFGSGHHSTGVRASVLVNSDATSLATKTSGHSAVIPLQLHTSSSISKGARLDFGVQAASLQSAQGEKKALVASSLLLLADALVSPKKGAAGPGPISLTEAISTLSTIQVVFLGGDLVRIDLQARVRDKVIDCERLWSELESRVSSGLDFDAEVFREDLGCRRRTLCLLGKVANISGLHIVCVREEFDDN